jgi:hypothetical protein
MLDTAYRYARLRVSTVECLPLSVKAPMWHSFSYFGALLEFPNAMTPCLIDLTTADGPASRISTMLDDKARVANPCDNHQPARASELTSAPQ